MEFEFFRQILEKYWNIKLHDSPTSGSRDFPTRTDRQTDMKKLTVAFGKFF
jgi:hypothetical protein